MDPLCSRMLRSAGNLEEDWFTVIILCTPNIFAPETKNVPSILKIWKLTEQVAEVTDFKIFRIGKVFGSVFKKFHETGVFDEKEIYPYITEGIGEDILPKNVDFSIIDHFEKVSDKDGAIMARKLATEEGILLGYSAGSAMAGAIQMKDKFTKDDVVVLIFHDHGSRYVAKIFNDEILPYYKHSA